MGRPAKISKEEVLETQKKLKAGGKDHGMLGIRAALGRGSYGTIAKHLKGATDDSVAEAPEEARQSFESTWMAAYRLGKLHRTEEMSKLQTDVGDMASLLDRAEHERKHLTASLEKVRRELDSSNDRTAKLLESAVAREEVERKNSINVESKDQLIDALRASLEDVTKQLHRVELEKARLEGQLRAIGLTTPDDRAASNGKQMQLAHSDSTDK